VVIERIPFPARVGGLQDREFLFGREVQIHGGRRSGVNPNPADYTIRSDADADIRETPSGAAPPLVGVSRQPAKIIRIFPTER
jgi:hypothetical protein